MFGVFPILNPVIVIYFTQDYRRYVFGQPSSIAVVVSDCIRKTQNQQNKRISITNLQ